MSCIAPTTLRGALDALAEDPDALVLAGGTDLMVEVNMGHRSPVNVVAVSRVTELRSWMHDPVAATVRIGAGVTYGEVLSGPLAALVPALAQAARTVGSPQIRHAATVGGNVGTASPAGDGLPVLAALDAIVHLESAVGSRDVPFAEFATAPKRTVRQPGELITAITVPVLQGWQGYAKVGVRNAMVIATATCCLVVDEEARTVRIALGSVGPVIIRATEAEAFAAADVDWTTGAASDAAVQRIGSLAAAAARPIDDHRSTADYRRHAIGVLAARLAAGGRSHMGDAMPADEIYALHVNGERREVRDAWVGESLLYVLRERLGLMGSKGACEQGECGSCSVLVDDELVCSCLCMAATMEGCAITTIEGVAPPGVPTDVQQAFVDAGAVQCGFCTPGLIVAAHALLERNAEPSEYEIREELSGNICRCTGYGRIIDAVQRVAISRGGGR